MHLSPEDLDGKGCSAILTKFPKLKTQFFVNVPAVVVCDSFFRHRLWVAFVGLATVAQSIVLSLITLEGRRYWMGTSGKR